MDESSDEGSAGETVTEVDVDGFSDFSNRKSQTLFDNVLSQQINTMLDNPDETPGDGE